MREPFYLYSSLILVQLNCPVIVFLRKGYRQHFKTHDKTINGKEKLITLTLRKISYIFNERNSYKLGAFFKLNEYSPSEASQTQKSCMGFATVDYGN